MSLWVRNGLLVAVCLSCLLLALYSTQRRCYYEQQEDYIGVDRHVNTDAERAPTAIPTVPNVTASEPTHTLPQSLCSTDRRIQVVDVVDVSDRERKWNVFDTRSSGKYTIIVQTYKRNDLLQRFLGHYNHKSFPLLDQIIVIWNNIGVALERAMFQQAIYQAGVPVRFIVPRINSVRNKLQPFPQIQTAGM